MAPSTTLSDPIVIEALIRRREPQEDERLVSELAVLWSGALDDVLSAMMDATAESGRVVWPREARAEVVLELAKLSQFAADQIVKDRLKGRHLSSIDLAEERVYLISDHGKERSQNTGKMLAEHIWNRIYDEYVAKYPLLTSSGTPQEVIYKTKKRRNGTSAGVKRNHFLPAFANKPWADSDGNILVARHWVDGGVQVVKRAYRNWGFEMFLYPQWLERHFQAVESDAAKAYRHLLDSVPLPPDERRVFTTFLVVQMLRTPNTIARLGLSLRRLSTRRGWRYPMDAGSLRRAYETLFENDDIHARLHARMTKQQWRMLRPGREWGFPRIDSGIVTATVGAEKRSALLFPLSPEQCLCIGPSRAREDDLPIPLPVQLSESDTVNLVRRLAAAAVHSIALPCGADVSKWRALLARYMSTGTREEIARYKAWGSLHER